MKPVYFFSLFLMISFFSCMNSMHETIHGNGKITTNERSISSAQRIKCAGGYDIQLTQGSPVSLKIEADENLQPYIIAENNGDGLTIRTKDDVNIDASQKIKVYITTDKLEEFKLEGSGNLTAQNKFTGSDHLDLSISGTGNVHFNVNTPQLHCSISGTGDIYLTGETKNSKIEIAGAGNYHAEDLMSENATIKIAGTGDARLFASGTLNIEIAGLGSVFYKGNPSITQKIAGTGKIQKIE